MKMTGKLSILIFLCKTNCGSIQYNSEGEGCPTNHSLSQCLAFLSQNVRFQEHFNRPRDQTLTGLECGISLYIKTSFLNNHFTNCTLTFYFFK